MASISDSSTRITTVRTRRWVRRDPPVWSFLWRGLLPLLGLLGLLWFAIRPFAHQWMETLVREETRAQLDAKGFDWVKLSVSGQHVVLSGTEPNIGDGKNAISLAEAADCPSFFGRKTCAVDVRGNFTQATRAAIQTPIELAPSAAIAPDYRFSLKDGLLILTGEMPSQALRDQAVQAAQALINPPRVSEVQDQMSVKAAAAIDGYGAIVERGVRTVAACENGVSELSNSVFSVRCNVTRASEASIRTDASAELSPPLQLGQIELLAAEVVSQCESSFAEEFKKSQVKFASGSAVISTSSNPLLDRLASLVKDCPGTVRVEGHTDSVGQAQSNQVLSEARANAVRDALISRGVDATRLVAQGFGQSQPIADNTSANGRAQNRRIEFNIVTVN